jgi:hypothetical protein
LALNHFSKETSAALKVLKISSKEFDANANVILVYHILFITAQLFQLVLISDALKQLSLIQLVTTTIFNFAIWGYTLVQLVQADKLVLSPLQASLKLANTHPTFIPEVFQIIVVLAFCIGWIFITYKLYFVFGWTTYKEMGADVSFRSKQLLLI